MRECVEALMCRRGKRQKVDASMRKCANETNEIDQMNQTDEIDKNRPDRQDYITFL